MAGEPGEEESIVPREAEEQAGDAPQVGGGEEGHGRGEARGGDRHDGGDGRQVPRQRRGPDEALRAHESMIRELFVDRGRRHQYTL